MKKMSFILLTFFLLSNAFGVEKPTASSQTIHWYTNYDEASEVAKSKDLPILLFFTGSDWCTWCTKLEEEALHQSEFADLTSEKFVFVKLDFPMHHPLEPRAASQNQQLKKKYNISGFPSIVIVDEQGRRIGSTGYRQGGATRYASHLLQMVGSYAKHQSTIKDLGTTPISYDELKELYIKAKDLGQIKEAMSILESGLKSDRDNFFLLQKYRLVIEEGDLHDKEAIRLKDRLLTVKPDQAMRAFYDISIVEFQVLQQKKKRDKLSPASVAAPLVSYIEKFGAVDPEAWRVDMAISQLYLEFGQREKALKYAKEALGRAPAKVHPDIENAIHYINTQIHKTKE